MSVTTKIRRRPAQAIAVVGFGAAEAFAINKVTSTPTWWWWLLLVVALIGAVGCAVLVQRAPENDTGRDGRSNKVEGPVSGGSAIKQQSAGDKGQNISADNGSFAANRVDKIGDITLGGQRPTGDDPKNR